MALARYTVQFRPSAIKELSKLDRVAQARVRAALQLLAQDPRPPLSRKLKGRPGYRVRVGDFRVIYLIEDAVLLVVVVRVGHRREVYEQ